MVITGCLVHDSPHLDTKTQSVRDSPKVVQGTIKLQDELLGRSDLDEYVVVSSTIFLFHFMRLV